MAEAQIKLSHEEFARRVKQYRSDPFIAAIKEIIYNIYDHSKPIIKVYPNHPEENVFDIDEKSKEKIEYF
jgi:hypothetical protein